MPNKITNSYAIFNNYTHVLPLLLRAYYAHFPEKYRLRIYHDTSTKNDKYYRTLLQLQENNLLELNECVEEVYKCKSMLWRMKAIWDSNSEFVFCKDADSIPTLRERKIMEHFIDSDYAVCGINDNEAHDIPLMGGMIGFNCKKFIEITGLQSFEEFINLATYTNDQWQEHGTDQKFLNSIILEKVINSLIVYRVFQNAQNYKNKKHIKCIFEVPNIVLNDINSVIRDHSDEMICYIGASGSIREFEPQFSVVRNYECKTVCEFFNKVGNRHINQIIDRCER